MGYGPPNALAAGRAVMSGYVAPGASSAGTVLPNGNANVRGNGYLAGEFPAGITTASGVPVSAVVRVMLRAPGDIGDGQVVAEVMSAADGTWRVDGLSTVLRFDVVGRLNGYNDIIMAGITPAPM